ncbi:MAG: hypothetical protein JXP36_11690 [Bacteroidales bacterium]|nr:hypothetical protein [Bacteroidales bacterium]
MGAAELRKELHSFIDHADERFLRMVHSLASEYTKDESDVIAYRAGNPITKNQLYQELKEAEQEIESGDYMTIEEFAKESSQWK